MKFSLDIDVQLPRVPNYLILSDDKTVDISELSDPELRALGAEWVNELVKKAEERRRDENRI